MGTIILTGANSSAGIPTVERLLNEYPQYKLALTVRNSDSADKNTSRLLKVISRHPTANVSIHSLDLFSLASVGTFCSTVISHIKSGELPPLKAIICNASYWNLVAKPGNTEDGYDQTLQVSHIAHVALVLRLLGHFASDGGRVVLFSSVTHIPGKSPLEKYPPEIPPDLDKLVHPTSDGDIQGRGFQRYANAKLVVTAWMYALNRRLEKDERLKSITAVTINPGNLSDSRAFRTNVPSSIINMQRFVFTPFLPLLRRFSDPLFRRSAEAAVDIADLAVNHTHPAKRGYFTMREEGESSPQSLEMDIQERIWSQSAAWAGITKDDTVLTLG